MTPSKHNLTNITRRINDRIVRQDRLDGLVTAVWAKRKRYSAACGPIRYVCRQTEELSIGVVHYLARMNEYDQEKWFDLNKSAILELKRAAMTGRIGEARDGIATRLQELEELPDLHTEERQAISDALSTLRMLEREEERFAAEDKKRILERAAQNLESRASRLKSGESPDSGG